MGPAVSGPLPKMFRSCSCCVGDSLDRNGAAVGDKGVSTGCDCAGVGALEPGSDEDEKGNDDKPSSAPGRISDASVPIQEEDSVTEEGGLLCLLFEADGVIDRSMGVGTRIGVLLSVVWALFHSMLMRNAMVMVQRVDRKMKKRPHPKRHSTECSVVFTTASIR